MAQDSGDPRYVTTPIYYVNDRPHVGHCYSTTLADVYARFMRLAGHEVLFLTGTDEHAAKVVDAAAAKGMNPLQWADQNAKAFQDTFTWLGLTFDDFVRTTQDRHKTKVLAYLEALRQTADVYVGEYEGWYDAGQEEYLTEARAKEVEFKSPINGKPLVRKRESNSFFRLSAYQKQLEQLLNGQTVDGQMFHVEPEARRNEVLGRLREGLNDVPISRSGANGWGIPFPGSADQTVYVWIDALFNYLSIVDTDERRKFWESGPLHVIAKDILWFHAVIWPAFLLALRKCKGFEWVRLPKLVYSHSFWISEGQKMSKSLGNFIDLETIQRYVATYGNDAWRHYLVTQGPLGATDADFAAAKFHETYSTDLVNTVGNCTSRVTAMINKYYEGVVPSEKSTSQQVDKSRNSVVVLSGFEWPKLCEEAVSVASRTMEKFDLYAAVEAAMGLVRRVDAFINATEPFKVAKDPARQDELGTILYQCLEALRIASLLLWPVLPEKMEQFWKAIKQDVNPREGGLSELARWGGLAPGTKVDKVALYPRIELPKVEAAV